MLHTSCCSKNVQAKHYEKEQTAQCIDNLNHIARMLLSFTMLLCYLIKTV